MRICFVAPNAYPLLSGSDDIEIIGGSELQQVIVARKLAERGHQVSMICLNYGQPDSVEIDGVTVLRAYRPDDGVPILRFVSPRLTSFWRCFRRADADIYYYRAAGMLLGVIARFCMKYGRKSVFAAAGNPDLMLDTPRIKYARDRWLFTYGLRHADRILVQNEEQERLCLTNFGRLAIRVPNCYPSPVKRISHISNGYVLWVSTIRALKRPELFLDVADRLPNLQFRMIGGPGNGEPALFKRIRARAEKTGNVRFLGFVPFTKIDEQFDGASLFVNTSDSEGFPNTFLQAWARGIPTVSFVDAGARLEGRPVGTQVATLDEMVEAISVLASADSARIQEGQRCMTYFEANHLVDRNVDLYENIFDALLRGNGSAAQRHSGASSVKDPRRTQQ